MASRSGTRRRRRLIVLLIILLLLLAVIGALYVNYRATRTIGLDFDTSREDLITAPDYLFSFTGPENDRMLRPIGILAHEDRVYVADGQRRVVDIFDLEGERVGQLQRDVMVRPLYIAWNPVEDEFYVTDRRLRSVEVFDAEGRYIREYDPEIPEDELTTLDDSGFEWVPIALDFSDDGSLFVVEYLNGHRLLKFGPDGEFEWSVGTAGFAESANQDPEVFQFPNGVHILGGEVWVTDSNNRRIQIFDSETGEFLRIEPTGGLPRGFDFLIPAAAQEGTPTHLAVVDTLAHDVTLWDTRGNKVLAFGGQGVLEGQFSYPGDLSVSHTNGYIYVTDSSNGRVQVWGWPQPPVPIPTPQTPWQWALCFSPLLLLPLLLLFRRRKFFATQEWLELFIAEEELHLLPDRRRKWIVEPEVFDELEDVEQEDVRLGDLLEPFDHSESDASDIEERFETDHITGVRLAIAQRAWVFCTEDYELRRFAKVMDLDVVNRLEYIDRFTDEDANEEEEAGMDDGGPIVD